MCISIDKDDAIDVFMLDHSGLSDHWDMVSGVAFTYSPSTHMHFTLHLSTVPVTVQHDVQDEAAEAAWKQQLVDNQATFSAERELHGHATSKVWGMTSSYSGHLIATCATFHPTNQLEYTIPADQVCLVHLSDAYNGNGRNFIALGDWADSISSGNGLCSYTWELLLKTVSRRHLRASNLQSQEMAPSNARSG